MDRSMVAEHFPLLHSGDPDSFEQTLWMGWAQIIVYHLADKPLPANAYRISLPPKVIFTRKKKRVSHSPR